MGDRLTTIDMGRKEVGCSAPFGVEGAAGSQYNAMWPVLMSTSVPSGILIHQTVNWLQQTRAENWEGVVPPFSSGLGPHLTHCRHGRGLPAYQVAS